jgi:hypothetical protein
VKLQAGDNYSTAIRITNSLNYGYGVGIDFAQPPTSGASVAVTGAITNDYDSDNNYSTRFYMLNFFNSMWLSFRKNAYRQFW